MSTKRSKKSIGADFLAARKKVDPIKAFAAGLDMHLQVRRIEVSAMLCEIVSVEVQLHLKKMELQKELIDIEATLKTNKKHLKSRK